MALLLERGCNMFYALYLKLINLIHKWHWSTAVSPHSTPSILPPELIDEILKFTSSEQITQLCKSEHNILASLAKYRMSHRKLSNLYISLGNTELKENQLEMEMRLAKPKQQRAPLPAWFDWIWNLLKETFSQRGEAEANMAERMLSHRNEMAKLLLSHRNEMAEIMLAHRNEMAEIMLAHRNEMAEIMLAHRNEMAKLKNEMAELILSHRNGMAKLKAHTSATLCSREKVGGEIFNKMGQIKHQMSMNSQNKEFSSSSSLAVNHQILQ